MALTFVLAVALVAIAVIAGQPWMRERRRRRHAAAPFPAAWRAILRRRVPRYLRMPFARRRELERLVQVFVAEKDFIGCDGVSASCTQLLGSTASPAHCPWWR